MASIFLDDDFGFDPPEIDLDNNFNFTAKFKIIEINGYKLHIHKIFKRSLSKINLKFLEDLIKESFPLSINDVSGIDVANFTVNKNYDGEFELTHYSDKTFDLYLGGIIEKEKK